jgi:hypothetical protein
LLFTEALVKDHAVFEGSFLRITALAVGRSAVKIFVMMLLNVRGGAFLVPKESRKKGFDWRMERPRAD